MFSLLSVVLFICFLLSPLVQAVEVTPDSDCSAICINDPTEDLSNYHASYTLSRNVVCNDWELYGSDADDVGQKFKSCLECESTSTHKDRKSGENDVYWFLFNMKFTIDWCIFGFQKNEGTIQSKACKDRCSDGLQAALLDRLLQTNSTLQYQYCETGDGAFSKGVQDCMSCLEEVPDSKSLVNYLRALQEGCNQKPKIGGSTAIKLGFQLYPNSTSLSAAIPSTLTLTPSLTTPTASLHTTTAAAAAAEATVTVSSSPRLTASPSTPSSNRSLRLGLGVGLGIGLGLIIIALLAFLSRRLYRRHQAEFATKLRKQWENELDSSLANRGIWQLHGDTGAAEMGTNTKDWRGTEMPVGVAALELEGPAVPKKDKKWRTWSHGGSSGKRDTGIVSSESENRGSLSTSP